VDDVSELNYQLGAFQDINCRSLKSALADVEYRGTGRVLLSDFYRIGLEGKYLFIEYMEYLRKLGALDESDPQHPSVIVANYVAGPANCMTTTNFHSVCCFDECEKLLGQLEGAIAAPTSSPHRIAELVAHMQSDTVDAPRNLSSALLGRLEEIATQHDGVVPLHGRLFQQWMHHAYPLECSYPHMSGTTSPQSPDDWLDETETDEISAPEEERMKRINMARPTGNSTQALPWVPIEELVVPVRVPRQTRSSSRKIFAFLAVVSLAAGAVRLVASVSKRRDDGKSQSHLV